MGDQTDLLTQDEVAKLGDRIRSAWGRKTHYWWPLDGERPKHAEAFQTHYVERELGYQALRDILAAHSVANVLELIEGGEGRRIPLIEFEACYGGLESFWTAEPFDWMIYASHESSITIAGHWLLPAVQAAWPNWRERVWTTPFYQRPD